MAHILDSTFNFACSQEDLVHDEHCSNRDVSSFQERKQKQIDDLIGKSVKRVDSQWDQYQKEAEKHGILCCSTTCHSTRNRCMQTFTSKSALESHEMNGKHKFPPVDLKTRLHEIHLSGTMSFSLSIGSLPNRSKAADNFAFKVIRGKEIKEHHHWFKKGCYNSVRKTPYRASQILLDDLEALFLAGYQIDHNEKSAANKYTPAQALAFLSNLKLDDGRRKYSHDKTNLNGSLPSIKYIKSWFARRVKRGNEEQLNLSNKSYVEMNEENLRKIVKSRFCLGRISEKALLKSMLGAYHSLNYIDEYDTKGNLDTSQMKLICKALSLPDIYTDKEFLVRLLELKDRCELIEKESDDIDEDILDNNLLQEVEPWDDFESHSEEELKKKVLEELGMDKNGTLREDDLLVACLRVHDESIGKFGNRYSSNVQELENLCRKKKLPWGMNQRSLIYFLRQAERNKRVSTVEGAIKSSISVTIRAEVAAESKS